VVRAPKFPKLAENNIRKGFLEGGQSGKVSNVFVLRGGMGKKQRRTIAEAIAAVPESEPRVILARAATLVRDLMMLVWTPCSWRCRFLGRERCSSMLGVSIGFTMLSMSFASTTMSILRC
jgi:hypothetical protein